MATPTFIVIAAPPPFPLPAPPLRHHTMTLPPMGPQQRTARTPRGTRRCHGAIEKSLGGKRHHHFRAEMVCSPPGQHRPHSTWHCGTLLFILLFYLSIQFRLYIYIVYYEGEQDRVLAIRDDELGVRDDELVSLDVAGLRKHGSRNSNYAI